MLRGPQFGTSPSAVSSRHNARASVKNHKKKQALTATSGLDDNRINKRESLRHAWIFSDTMSHIHPSIDHQTRLTVASNNYNFFFFFLFCHSFSFVLFFLHSALFLFSSQAYYIGRHSVTSNYTK